MKINFKRLNDSAIVPTRGSKYAAGYDLHSTSDVEIKPGETVKINTGIAMEIPDEFVGLVFARSGIATKRGLRPANCVGVIDPDYRGEIMVALHNDSDSVQRVNIHERVAQISIVPFLPAEFTEVDELNDTVRGTGGFGSTGISDISK